jgi:hypothetical protein
LTNLLRLPAWLFIGAWLVKRARPWVRREAAKEEARTSPRTKPGA